MIDPLETVAAAGVGTAIGGALVRALVHKWLRDREDFESQTRSRFDTAKDYVDAGLKSVREEGAEARRVLREHVDHEDKILRDRWHNLDTLTQILVNNIGLMREELKAVVEAQGETNAALHEIDKTLSGMAKKNA